VLPEDEVKMKYPSLVLLIITVVFAGCSSPGGLMRESGRITPCPDWHTDNQACGNAIWNAKVIGAVQLGQTQEEVRMIMRHDPERREGSLAADGKKIETWSYITDYDAERMTTLTFTDGTLTAIGQDAWKSDD
jgi:hypothetical protein